MPDTHTHRKSGETEKIFLSLFQSYSNLWVCFSSEFWTKTSLLRQKWVEQKEMQHHLTQQTVDEGQKTRQYRPGYGHYYHDSGSDLIQGVGLRTILFSFSNLASGNTFQADAKFVANCLFSHFRNSSSIISLRDATLYHISALNYQQF